MAKEGNFPFVWNRIHFKGDFTLRLDNPSVYRYMPFSRVQDMLKDSEITFVSPNLWDDPYEKRYYNVKVDGKENVVPKMVCLCFTTSENENADAFWNRSKTSGEQWVCVKFSLYELLDSLNDFAKKNDARIYVSSAQYTPENDIKNAAKKWRISEQYLEPAYVRLMSLKRNAFRYENEIRIFVVWDNDSQEIKGFEKTNDGKGELLKISFKNRKNCFIKKITVGPAICKTDENDNSKDAKKKSKKNESEYKNELEQLVKSSKRNITINQSQFGNFNKCDGIKLSK